MNVLSPNQDLLTDYLAALGMSVTQRLLILMELWDPQATLEMLGYIADTQETDHKKLLETASKIARKYKDSEEYSEVKADAVF